MLMRKGSGAALAAALLLAACGQGSKAPEAATPTIPTATAPAPAAIPASLAPFGEGWPKAGDPCRRLGESAATANWLDDSAVLVGCPTAEAAALLGGKTLASVDGVTVVSVPTGDANAGMVMTDDARVEGTDFNATAELPCATDGSEPKLRCKAGVKRKWGEDGTTIVVVTRPDGGTRSLYFRETEATGADSAQADGSAAYAFKAERAGDETRISFGPERYVVPDAFVVGG